MGGQLLPPSSYKGSSQLKLHHILSLRALFPFHNFEFDFLTLLQSTKALAGNVAVVDEDVGSIFLGNKSVSLGIAKPFDLTLYSHKTLISQKPYQKPARAMPGNNQGKNRKRSRKGRASRVW
jgi:hypothetical protein